MTLYIGGTLTTLAAFGCLLYLVLNSPDHTEPWKRQAALGGYAFCMVGTSRVMPRPPLVPCPSAPRHRRHTPC
jgi:hypothetical protein